MVLSVIGPHSPSDPKAIGVVSQSIERALKGSPAAIDKLEVSEAVRAIEDLIEKLRSAFRLTTMTAGMSRQERVSRADALLAHADDCFPLDGLVRKLRDLADTNPRKDFARVVVKLAPALEDLRAAIEKAEEDKERFLAVQRR